MVALLIGSPALGGTTWTGNGPGTSWGTAGNWGGALPPFDGTASVAVGSGFASGTTLTLDGTRYVNDLTINTNTAFTIASGTGGTLDLRSGNLTRTSTAGVAQTISAGIVLGNTTGAAYTGTWNNAGTQVFNVSGNISEVGGSRSITKTGTGYLQLSGTNSFTGGLTLSAGTVSVSADANLGASGGGITFNGGTLEVRGSFTGTRSLTLNTAATISMSTGSMIEQSGVVSGNGNLSINTGTVVLSGSGSNGTGNTTVANTGAVLSLRGTVSLGSGLLALSGGVLEVGNGSFTRSLGTAAGQVNMAANPTVGAGFAAWGGERVINLGGSGATVTFGTGSFVASTKSFQLGSVTANGTVDFQNGINLAGITQTITLVKGTGSSADARLSGVISNGTLVFNGVTGTAAGRVLMTNGNNSYAGNTSVYGGSLWVAANATSGAGNTVLGTSANALILGNATGSFDASVMTAAAVTIGRGVTLVSGNTGVATLGGVTADSSTFTGNIVLGSGTAAGKNLSLSAASGGSVTFSGVISDPSGLTGAKGVLTKTGDGTVTLSGANTYLGATIVNAGTLTAAASSGAALGTTSGITANAGGTLQLGASNQINNSAGLTLAGGTLAKSDFSEGAINAAGIGALTLTAAGSRLDFGSGSVGVLSFASLAANTFTVTIDNWTGTSNSAGSSTTDRLIFNSDQASNLSAFRFAGYADGATQFALGGGFYEVTPVTPVPEPSTYAAAALAAATLVSISDRARRKRRVIAK